MNAAGLQEKNAAYYAAHRDEVRAQQRRYYLANRERFLAKRRRQRARDRAQRCELTDAQWEFTLAWFGRRCVYCGAPETLLERLQLEHVVPLSAGGGHVIGNCAPACGGCNASKNNRPLAEWLAGRATGPFSAAELARQLDALATAWGLEHGAPDAGDATAGRDARPTEADGGTAAPAVDGAPADEGELGPPLSLDGVLEQEVAA